MKKSGFKLKLLQEIFPVFLVALAFVPLLFGFIIDAELIDGREIILTFLWLSLLCIPATVLKSRSIYRFVCTLYFIGGFLEITHWVLLNGPITLTSILVLSNTNLQEAHEFFDLKASLGLLVLLPYIGLFVVALKKSPEYSSSKIKSISISILLIASFFFILENAWHQRLIRKGTPQ